MIYLEVDKKWDSFAKKIRTEIFNYNNKDGFEKFIKETENNSIFREVFEDENEDLEISSKRWLKAVNSSIRKSFKKVRIGKYKTDAKLESLFHQKEYLMESLARSENDDKIMDVENIKEKLDTVVEAIAKICCEKIRRLLMIT